MWLKHSLHATQQLAFFYSPLKHQPCLAPTLFVQESDSIDAVFGVLLTSFFCGHQIVAELLACATLSQMLELQTQ